MTNDRDVELVQLPLDKIQHDDDQRRLQPRERLNADVVQNYKELLASDEAQFPPVVVFLDNEDRHWLADGFHRYDAYKQDSSPTIPAQIHRGSYRDALQYSLSANAKHGLHRSNDDKRHSVTTALHDPEWSKWSDQRIGTLCAVSHTFVAKIRASLATVASDNPAPQPERVYQTKHGTTAKMKTGNIGHKHQKEGPKGEARRLAMKRLTDLERRLAQVQQWLKTCVDTGSVYSDVTVDPLADLPQLRDGDRQDYARRLAEEMDKVTDTDRKSVV